jgi:DNA topoisomerase-1
VLKEGRYGPYVTDGTTNVSLPRGDTVEALTPERAAELLTDKRAKGPAKPRKKAAAKKAGAKKKSAAKKAAPRRRGS